MHDELTSEQQTALFTAPDALVRWRHAEWPGAWRDGRERWRTAQQDYASEHGVELPPSAWAREWQRRRLGMLAEVDHVLLTFSMTDWPDATDERAAWMAWGDARRAWLDAHDWATGAHLDAEKRRRWLETR